MTCFFPNCVMLIRDVAHTVRVAAKSPLHNDEAFGAVWDDLCGKEHALIPDIQPSDKHEAVLQLAQRSALVIPGNDHPLQTCLTHFACAKQRFGSVAHPAAKLACVLVPVTTLRIIASYVRIVNTRRARALHALTMLTAELCMALGLSADYGLILAIYCCASSIARTML